MHPLLVGGNPFTTTSIYGLILYLEKKWGIHYSMGGTGNIIKGFEKLMEEIEIEIIKNTEVKEIITKNNKITGVVVDNEEIIEANNVICNALQITLLASIISSLSTTTPVILLFLVIISFTSVFFIISISISSINFSNPLIIFPVPPIE